MKDSNQGVYGIGAVVKRTGLAAPTIRIWEKRYGAVKPGRTETNRRLYSGEDVTRLGLLRSLTERGHSIRNIANLELPQLQKQLAEDEQAGAMVSGDSVSPSRRGRVLIAGKAAATLLSGDEGLDSKIVGRFDTITALIQQETPPTADLLFIEAETLHPETVASVREVVNRTRAARTILLYRFSSSKTATALARAIPGLKLLSAPLESRQIRREVLVQLGSLFPTSENPPVVPEDIPERIYTTDQLLKFARISTSVDCECPQHLAGLLQGLAAFEKYSSECEDRNPQDAALHAFLHRATANVRRTMEDALQHLVRVEGIELD
ncbi:MAG: helix-turn-helix-type transcriptional regulator [Roseibacillus sp.]|nr:helix-turn-helix-type transcriptional regulator [Roseibacillus sp.]|tara:strand:- start:24435 stop:25400 length:966 start_codon:yes stop_codon:yes gene_type:complete